VFDGRGPATVLVPIPARSGRLARNENLVTEISTHLKDVPRLEVVHDALYFNEHGRQNKGLNEEERYRNIGKSLALAHSEHVKGKRVIVIDDIVTTGATFYYAERLLRSAGAHDVTSIALAKSIS
jgi:predicted amidophosphoribosyltransferase